MTISRVGPTMFSPPAAMPPKPRSAGDGNAKRPGEPASVSDIRSTVSGINVAIGNFARMNWSRLAGGSPANIAQARMNAADHLQAAEDATIAYAAGQGVQGLAFAFQQLDFSQTDSDAPAGAAAPAGSAAAAGQAGSAGGAAPLPQAGAQATAAQARGPSAWNEAVNSYQARLNAAGTAIRAATSDTQTGAPYAPGHRRNVVV